MEHIYLFLIILLAILLVAVLALHKKFDKLDQAAASKNTFIEKLDRWAYDPKLRMLALLHDVESAGTAAEGTVERYVEEHILRKPAAQEPAVDQAPAAEVNKGEALVSTAAAPAASFVPEP